MSKGKDFVVNIIGDTGGVDKAFETFKDNAGKAAVGAAAAFAAVKVGEALAAGLDAGALEDKVAASLGASAAEAERWGDAAAGAYRAGWGETMEDASAAVENVVGNISSMRTAGGADIEATTSKALALAQAMDVDVAESTKAAGILISNGLAPDANAAFDLITAGLQKVPTAMRGEALDAMSEYSVNFANLGISGDEAMGMLAGSAGISSIALDKTGDAIKEFTILSQDTARMGPVFEQLGLDAQSMSTAIAGGGEGAKAAFGQIVTGLQGITDPSAKAQAAIALFGSPVEDLGINEIPAFVDALASASTGLGDTSGAADAMATTLSSNPKASVESMRRSFEGWQQDLVELPGPLGTAAVATQAFGADALALGSSVAMGILALSQMNVAAGIAKAGQLAGAVATGVSTAAQWAWNAALSANPIGIVVVAIAALVAGLVWFFTQTEAGKAVVTAVWGGIQSAIGGVTGWWTNTAQPALAAGWNAISGFFRAGGQVVGSVMSGALAIITKVWSYSPIGLITGNWDSIMGFFKGIPGKVGTALGGVGDAIKGAFKGPFNAVAGFWNRSIGNLHFEVPDWVPGVGGKGFSFPKIPMLASGAVVTSATLAMIGEGREPEAVLPLSRLDAMLDNTNPQGRAGNSNGGPLVHINTYNAGPASSSEVARDLAWQMGR
ncbi:hypothetical protein ACFWGN_16135 [Oerskovia sp. NPDC060338]|uniref:hypothetical protein n=1 Tax=Oerskovia sp. NPDC060338 TaxID=3347100 RepID=UPI00365C6094